jgi:hypothetical protein
LRTLASTVRDVMSSSAIRMRMKALPLGGANSRNLR